MAETDNLSDLSDLTDLPSQHDFLQEFKQSQMQGANRGLVSGDNHGPDPQYDLDRPGVEVTQQEDMRYERAGVSHLIHAWHEKVKKGTKVSIELFRLSKSNLVY
jgi:hypothetical protein